MQEWIGLIDCNNFFVSCERLFRPDLKNKPVVVLSSNDGCVVARSQEIKDKGIPMGMPYFQIKDIIKDIEATTFSSHFALYRDVSRRVFEVVRREFEDMIKYSVDEAFFTLHGSQDAVQKRVEDLKCRVEREVGIPVSIGVALSKTLAKHASTVAKKTSGTYVLTTDEWNKKTNTVHLRDIWGVGFRSAETYKSHGLLYVSDLLTLERRTVSQLFGVVGVRLWQELQGMPSSALSQGLDTQHSILHSRSFKATTNDILAIKDAVAYHVREASEDLRQQGLKARVLQVTLGTSRHGDYFLQGGSREAYFTAPTSDIFELLRTASALVDTLYKPGVPYKKAGILLYDFVPVHIEQLTMFATKEEEKTQSLTPMIDALNTKLGKGSKVLVGTYLKAKDWQTSQALKSPSYTTSWKDIREVKT